MKKLLLAFVCGAGFLFASAQDAPWTPHTSTEKIAIDKAVSRLSFPENFKLFDVRIESLRSTLMNVAGRTTAASTVISLPNADGGIEQFEVYEASNFEPALQARFPEIRAFSGKGITDKYATLKLSISPQGLQTMVFRTEKENEFIEPYSQDHRVYAVFRSQRKAGQIPWRCSTPDADLETGLNNTISDAGITARSGGDLKTMRLAQSVTAEYSNYFGATSSSQVGLVLAAINATLTRCNGVYEKDLALHLNLVASSTNVIYYNASTDPYDNGSTGSGGSWNNQLQNTLTANIGEANYDVGHLFGASGGGGNAGCIGCVCVNNQKGKGFTSPADGVPQGDNFDIDYVVHEIGHQLGGNHTFSTGNEGTGVNKEPGSGITIMGYAGITSQDLAPHSIDFYHQASIAQIQANLATKTCPVTVTMANATPVVGTLTNYTIPKSTPFALTGSASDANTGDALTYSWEQNDNASSSQTGANSVASATKATGPNWTSFRPSASPTRFFPQLSTILNGGTVSGPFPGGDAGANTEALSSVARTLNFRLTVRDNAPYVSTSPYSVGQTQFRDMTVTVNSATGPFTVTAPNTAVTWAGGSTQTITWSVAGTNGSPINCANVRILLSIDGGQTFPTVLSASTANDGSEALVIPATSTTTARVKIESIGNIFFDISNTNFTIGGAVACGNPSGLAASAITNTGATVSWGAVSGAVNYSVDYKTNASSTWISAASATTATSVALSGLTASTLYDYRVRTNCSGSSSAYSTAQFTTTGGGSGCSSAFEPNETQAAAVAVTSGITNTAAISTATDVDFFKITTTGTTNIVYNLAGPSGVDFDLYIYNSAGTQIGSGTSGTATENVTLNNQAAGTYSIKVMGYNGALSATCYTIKATATATGGGGCQSTYDVSTNGTTSGAAVIPFNTNITGLISPSGDVDNYKFTITTGGTITLTLGTLPGDYDLKLLNSAGTQVAISQNGSTTGETINYTAAAGTYYAQVFGYNGANSATVCYTLRVALGTASKPSTDIATGEGSLDVYPNPATSVLNINTRGHGLLDIVLYDIHGKAVKNVRTGDVNTQLNISSLPKGVYLLKIRSGEKLISTKKIVKS